MTLVFISFCICIFILVAISPIIYKLWIGEKIDIPFVLTASIAIYTLIHCWNSLQVMLINGVGTVKLQTYVVLVGLIAHVPLSLLLGKYIGYLGVIVSMSIINILYAFFFTTQIHKILNRTAKGIWIK